jgi:hypothetical protein
MQNADSRRAGLMAIEIFKLIKGLLLVVVGIGVFKLVHHDIVEVMSRWVGFDEPMSRWTDEKMTRFFQGNCCSGWIRSRAWLAALWSALSTSELFPAVL